MKRLCRAGLGAMLFAGVFTSTATTRAQEVHLPFEQLPAHPGPLAMPPAGQEFYGYPPPQVPPTPPMPVPPVPAAQPTSGQLQPPTGQRCWGFRWLPPNCFPYDADRASRQETLHFIFGSSYDFMGRRWERPWPRPASQPAGTNGWTDYR